MSLTPADRQEILELLGRYNHAIDGGQERAFAALFTADGEWDGPGGTNRGTKELEAMIVAYREHPDVGPSQHWVSNTVLEGGGEEASGRSYSYCVGLTADGESLVIELTGQYTDEFQKVDGRWLFRRRAISDVHPAAINEFSLEESQ